MRIIGGKFRSRVLAEFTGNAVRPTSDRAKESLFNILALKIRGKRVLDLFSGSGALGLESLSRDASEVVFNDFSKESISILKRNLSALKIEIGKEAKIYNYDYLTCLNAVQGEFDIIFIDPPYKYDYGVPAMTKIVERRLLSDDGIIVYERDKPFDGEVSGLDKYDERKYGKTYLTFFRRID
ncbi:MAG: 16S rRNA (guanine(966)-N(2))-methyltransferase RsmD [Clostridia bacterium]|nr:16S rRNA (guanine(966)-N(2))-methyltransferase RsmD [Clostridia bacterium]